MTDIIQPSTFLRLQKHAIPLVDTIDSVINRALDALEGHQTPNNSELKSYTADQHPDLTFTIIRSATIENTKLAKGKLYWNHILRDLVTRANKKGFDATKIMDTIGINTQIGTTEDKSYTFIDAVGISVQGQNSNDAWRAIVNLAKSFNLKIEVEFEWQQNDKAALPGQTAVLRI